MIDCWKPWLALADEAPRHARKNLGPSLFLGSRLSGDGREIFQGDNHSNQLVAIAINDDVARRLVEGANSALKAEIDRLRSALTWIAAHPATNVEAAAVARDALAKKE